MKKILILLLSLLIWMPMTTAAKDKTNRTLRIATYNIRGDVPRDGINRWIFRRDSLCKIILTNKFEVVGMQEVLINQLEDIKARTGYQAVGTDSLYNPIIYNPARIEVVRSNMFWLSASGKPHETGWDGKYERYCTWAELRDKRSDRTFFFFNTHLDHRGVEARKEGARLICDKALEIAGNAPIIILGDMNSVDSTEAYTTYTHHFRDARSLPADKVYGPIGTAHNFGGVHPVRIDYIFINKKVTPLCYRAIDEAYPNNFFPSDHYPVYIDVIIEK